MKVLYKVVRGEMHEIKVLRETKKRYFVERCEASCFYTQSGKDFACETQEEAAQENLNMAMTRVGMAEDRLTRASESLAKAKSLKSQYPN